MSSRRYLILFTLFCLMGLGVTQPDARVFMRTGGGTRQALETADTGWNAAASGPMELNERTTDLQVFAAPGTTHHALEQLKKLYQHRQAQVVTSSDMEMGWGMAAWPDGRRTTFLALSPRAFPRTLVFVNHSESTSAAQTTAASLPGIPDFPGARVGSTVKRTETGTATRFLHTHARQEEILAFYDGAMAANGWTPFFVDTTGQRAHAPLAVYTRGQQMSFISVSTASGPQAEQIITLLTRN